MKIDNQGIFSSSPQLNRANPPDLNPQLKQKRPLSASSPSLDRRRTPSSPPPPPPPSPSPQKIKNEETFRFHYRSFDGATVEIEASQIETSKGECPNSFGWAANTFTRRGYNPADGAAMDAVMQAGWREVGRLEYDDEHEDDARYVDMTPEDLCKEDVLIFRSPGGITESAARYEGNDFFSYVREDGECHFENRTKFIASHLDVLKRGATIMRETNVYRHRALAEMVRPLVEKLHKMDSSSRCMSLWPPKLSEAVDARIFNRFGLYSPAKSPDFNKARPPDERFLLPKEEFIAKFREEIERLNEKFRPSPEDVEKHADEIYEASKAHRRLGWVRSRVSELYSGYRDKEILMENGQRRKPTPAEARAMANSDPKYLEYVCLAGAANCQEASEVLSASLRRIVCGAVNVEVIHQDEQDGVDHVYVAIGRAMRTDIHDPHTWNRDVIVVDGWKGWIGSIGEMFPPKQEPKPESEPTPAPPDDAPALSSDAASLLA